MTITTISVSEKFHNWLTSKGNKGESYEDVIKRLLRNEYLQEYNSLKVQAVKESTMPIKPKRVVKNPLKLQTYTSGSKPKIESLKIQKPTLAKIVSAKSKVETKRPQKPKPQAPKITKKRTIPEKVSKSGKDKDEKLLQYKKESELELQRLETELELAKLANNLGKINEISSKIARTKAELRRN